MTNPRKILAVDDDPLNLEIMEEILADYPLITATSGDEAIEACEREHPDLVLLDIMMPGLSGYDVCKRIREHPDLRHTKVILVSAKAMTSERLAGYEAGADDYLTKPFDQDELLAKVRVYLRLCFSEQMDQLKADLLSLLSHELRTPLTGIMPASELLSASGTMAEDERIMWSEQIVENSKRLLALAEESELVCALRAGTHELNLEVVDLAELLKESCAEAFDGTDARAYSIEDSKNLKPVPLDRALMKRALGRVLQEAARLGADNAPVEIVLDRDTGQVSWSITTRGQGLEEQTPGSLFDIFSGREVDGQIVGADLGMALARDILRAHGGDLSATAEASQSTFRGWLAVHEALTMA